MTDRNEQIYAMLDDLADGAHRAFNNPDLYKGWIEDYTEKITNLINKEVVKAELDILTWATGGIKEFTEDGSIYIFKKIDELLADTESNKEGVTDA